MKSSRYRKRYKAIIFDVDGTLILNKRDGIPSKRVREAIIKAKEYLHVGIATSRSYSRVAHIFDHLKLYGLSILSGGSEIVDVSSKKIIFQKSLLIKDMMIICKLATFSGIKVSVYDNKQTLIFSSQYIPKNPLQLWIYAMSTIKADKFIEKISHISTIAINKVPSWKKNKVDLIITHAVATKQHAILKLSRLLNIETHEIIGVGDGHNDLPLLMACGLKVAMGNAVEDLKAIADYVAPTVEEDGVADIIEKFVLNLYEKF